MRTITLFIACAALVLASSFAAAALITVDGDLSDAAWSSSGVTVYPDSNDPAITDQYDIRYTRFLWDAAANTAFFNMETYAQLGHLPKSNFVNLMLDADNDPNTGTLWYETPGADYYFAFSLDFDNTPLTYGTQYGFYEWNSGTTQWDLMPNTGNRYSVSRGATSGGLGVEWGMVRDTPVAYADAMTKNPFGVEWGMVRDTPDYPDEFTWGIFLDDGGTSPDDYVTGQTGRIPEPGTMALLIIGIGGLYLKRQHK